MTKIKLHVAAEPCLWPRLFRYLHPTLNNSDRNEHIENVPVFGETQGKKIRDKLVYVLNHNCTNPKIILDKNKAISDSSRFVFSLIFMCTFFQLIITNFKLDKRSF